MSLIIPDPRFERPELFEPQTVPAGFYVYKRDNKYADAVSALFYHFGDVLYDVVNLFRPTSDSATVRCTQYGSAADYNDQQTAFPNIPAYHLTGAATWLVVYDVDALTDYSALVSCADTSTTNGWEIRIGSGPNDAGVLFHRAGSSFEQHHSTSAIHSAGSKNNFLAVSVVDGLIQTVPSIWINSSSVSTSRTQSATGAASSPSDPLYIGKREDGVTKLNGAIRFVGLFNRALSFAETDEIRVNLNQFLIPA